MSRKMRKGRRAVSVMLLFAIMVSMLSGCSTGTTVSDDMIPTVTDLSADDDSESGNVEATALSLSMNSSYLAELTRLDGDNTETATVAANVLLVLKATSMEEDLKVKIVNQSTDKVVTGTAFEISVTDSSGSTGNYTDSDEDGIIYIDSIASGSCTVSMTYSGSYEAPSDLTTTVAANLSYTVVDVSDEIKSESEINVPAEDTDTSGNDSAGTAETLTDTVASLESTKTAVTETVSVQKTDSWGQLVYSELLLDEYGNEMYSVILETVTHVDSDGDDKCDYCGTALDHVHSYTSKVTKSATCTTDGVRTYTCSCGDSYTEVIAAAGHTEGSDGKCTVCGTVITEKSTTTDTTDTTDSSDETTTDAEDETGTTDTTDSSDETTTDAEDETDTTDTTDSSDGTTTDAEDETDTTDTTDSSDETTTDDESSGTTVTARANIRAIGRLILTASLSDTCYIVYDTTSAPVYDTSSDPVYETTEDTTGYIYTGWQTIDGATYYFDEDGNYVTGTQVIDGIQYEFSDEGVRSGTIGIDVSKYQSSINWTKVANAGINFVIIRCGYRGYGSGVLVQDPMFVSHITGAKAAGLRVGIYFFSQAITEAEAVEEASMAVKLANQYGINMPIAIDSEYANGGAGRADGLSKSERTKITLAFCKTVASAGYTPMIYASKSWFSEHLDVSQFSSSYRIWVAHYADECGYTGRYEIWQNTSKGTVDGVSGYVDMNISSI